VKDKGDTVKEMMPWKWEEIEEGGTRGGTERHGAGLTMGD
jgi:hypothetical protein